MENKKLGGLLFALGILLFFVILRFNTELNQQNHTQGCIIESPQCNQVNSLLSLTNIGIGIIASIVSLGFYLLLFSRGDQAILDRLEQQKKLELEKEKFEILLSALDDFEKRALIAIKDQPGITQSTLMFRANMSRAKTCQVVKELEGKKLISRIPKKKTFTLFLAKNF